MSMKGQRLGDLMLMHKEEVSSKTLNEQLEDKTYLDKYSRRILYFFDVEDIVEGLVVEVQRLKDLAEQSPENYDGLTVADLVLVKLGAKEQKKET